MRQLEIVIASFVRTLSGIYHSRIRYPNQRADEALEQAARGPRPPAARIGERR